MGRFQKLATSGGKSGKRRPYRMRVEEVLDHWPEVDQRIRVIVSAKRAARLRSPDLRHCLRAML